MKKRLRSFTGAFLASAVLLAGLCGFAVVDLSTERYMPGRFEPMMQLSSIGADGAEFTLMGQHYFVHAAPLRKAEEALYPWRALLPAMPQWAAMLAERAYYEAERLLTRNEEG